MESSVRGSHAWLGMGVRQLAIFDAIARRRSFRGAARELGYVQSAVSRRVASLEHTVGAQLIERGAGRDGITLTAAGEVVAEHGRAVLDQLRAAKVDITGGARRTPLVIRAGLCAGVAAWLVPQLVAALHERRSGLRTEFLEVFDDDELSALVAAGVVDIAIGVVPSRERRFAVTPLLADPWVLLVPDDSLLARRGRPFTAAELRASNLLLPPRSRAADLATRQLEAAGISLRRATRTPTGPVMRAAVVARKAVALAPRLSIEGGHAGTATVAPGVALSPREIGIYWEPRRRTIASLEELRGAACDVLEQRKRGPIAIVG